VPGGLAGAHEYRAAAVGGGLDCDVCVLFVAFAEINERIQAGDEF
jgi:hypothetical protein